MDEQFVELRKSVKDARPQALYLEDLLDNYDNLIALAKGDKELEKLIDAVHDIGQVISVHAPILMESDNEKVREMFDQMFDYGFDLYCQVIRMIA